MPVWIVWNLPGTSRSTARSATLFTLTTESPGCAESFIHYMKHKWCLSALGRSFQGGQTQLGPTMFNIYGTFLSDFQLNRSRLKKKNMPISIRKLKPLRTGEWIGGDPKQTGWKNTKEIVLSQTNLAMTNPPCVDVLNMTDLNCRVLFTRRSRYCSNFGTGLLGY